MSDGNNILEAQETFVTELSPYYKPLWEAAKAAEEAAKSGALEDVAKDTAAKKIQADFFDRVFNIWFIKWPMKLCDYGDRTVLNYNVGAKKKWIVKELNVAARITKLTPTRTWEQYLTICEGRQGIAKALPAGATPGPRPRPIKRRRVEKSE